MPHNEPSTIGAIMTKNEAILDSLSRPREILSQIRSDFARRYNKKK